MDYRSPRNDLVALQRAGTGTSVHLTADIEDRVAGQPILVGHQHYRCKANL